MKLLHKVLIGAKIYIKNLIVHYHIVLYPCPNLPLSITLLTLEVTKESRKLIYPAKTLTAIKAVEV